MSNKFLLCLSLVLSSGIASKAEAQEISPIQTYDNRTVGKIEVKVENLPESSSFDRQTVLTKLRTRQGDIFSQYVFDQDLKQLAADYDRVEPQIQVQNGKVDITLKVWLRPIINKIEWEGNQYVKTRILRRELDVKPGTIFNRTDFNKAFNKVKEYYIKKGYFESQLSYRLVPNPKTREVDVLINISEGRSGKVENIVFRGFSKDEESDILDKLYTKKYSALTSWLTGRGKFIEEALEQDRLTIFNYLQDQGYADARVTIQILESPDKGKVVIDICADKGVLYRFGQISFNGNILIDDQDVEKVFRARPNGIYSPEKLRKTADSIKELYGRKGYIDTSVTYETQLMQNAPIYNVHFNVDEGQKYKIGMIRIIGNVQTESRVILRESLLVPGDTFDSRKLKVTQIRLENMGFFKSVNVYAVRTQDDLSLGESYRDIYIEVEETQTGSISLFGGFSSAENIFGGLELRETNFNYKGIGRIFSDGLSAVRGGGEFLHLKSNFGAKENIYQGSWMSPYFLDSAWRLGFDFTANVKDRLVSEDVQINTYNFGTFLSYPLNPYWTYTVKYQVKNFKNKVSNKAENERNEDKNPEKDRGIISAFGTNLVYDSTDNAMKPHRGLRSALEIEYAGAGGDVSFFRSIYISSYYTPLWRRGYMRYRWDFRFIFPAGKTNDFADIPYSERFFLGGANSVRGYVDFVLGPRLQKFDSQTKKFETINDAPTGGISSSLITVDYIQEILPMLDAFAFIDAGYVTDKQFSIGTYRMSFGVGVNVNLLGRMPFTFGYGIPVNAEPGQTRRFFFNMGGNF